MDCLLYTSPQYNSQIPHQLKASGTARHHKRKTGKQTYKQEYNEGIGESHKKSSNKIMKITARGRGYRTDTVSYTHLDVYKRQI